MLNQKESKQLIALLKKIDKPYEGLPKPIFKAIAKVVPFLACELIVVSPKGFLLTWRDDEWWKGWHFPGGLLRFRESFDERIQKTAWDELGIHIESSRFLFPMNYTEGPRGHDISMVFLCTTSMTPTDGKFFKKMPKDIIEGHKELWNKVKDYK